MLVSLKNARAVKKPALVPVSKITLKILEILKTEGYVAKFETTKSSPKKIAVDMSDKIFNEASRVSKPGRRLYAKAKQLRIRPDLLTILSTSEGIVTAKAARQKNIGGEILFEVLR